MKHVIIDANLLVLLITGLTQPSYIATHKRLSSYSIKEFERLLSLLNGYRGVVVTPNVLSEASNLLRHFGEPGRRQLGATLQAMVAESVEVYVASATACEQTDYLRLGLTDAAMLTAQTDDDVLLTDDLDLYIASVTAGKNAVNFTHLRDF